MKRHTGLKALLFVLQVGVLLVSSYWVLRWSYWTLLVNYVPWSIATLHDLNVILWKMATITAGIATMSTAVFAFKRLTAPRKGAATALLSFALLWAYTLAGMFARDHWQPGKPDDRAFGYVFGEINARFFFEYNFLTYMFEVATVVALVSGLLAWLSEFLQVRADKSL